MLKRVIHYATSHPNFVTLGGLSAIVCAIWLSLRLPVDAVPDITNVQVMLNTKTGSLDTEQIEKMVTYPVELEMQGIEGLTEMRSISKYGLSQIVLIFSDNTDIRYARQQIMERMQRLADKLPNGIFPEMAPITTGLGEIFMYAVKAKPGSKLSKLPEEERLMYLRTVQDFIIRPSLRAVQGVGDVDTNGGYEKQIHINILPQKMDQYGVSLSELDQALENLGKNYGGAYVEQKGKQIIVRSGFRIDSLKSIENFPIKTNYAGETIKLSRVAVVSADAALRVGAATLQGEEIVMGTALMLSGGNARTIASAVKTRLAETKYPDDIEIQILYSRETLVKAVLSTVYTNLAEGATLVILVLLILTGNFRAAIIVSLAIPLSMSVTIMGMTTFNVSANLMSLGAIDFGLLVDGSIVMTENYLRHITFYKNPDTSQRITALKKSAIEVVKPVTTGLFIVMLVYTPVLAMTGTEGKLYHPMAITVLMALGTSLLVAVLITPAMIILLLKNKSHHTDPLIYRYISKGYGHFLKFALSHTKAMTAIFLLFGILAVILFFRMGSNFIPSLNEGDAILNISRNADISLTESLALQKKSEKILSEYPEIQTIFSRIGTTSGASDPMGVNLSDTFLILNRDLSHWPARNGKRHTKDSLLSHLRERLEKEVYPQEASVTQPIEMRFNEMLEGSRADVTLRIYGETLSVLNDFTQRSMDILRNIRGSDSVSTDPLTAMKVSPVLDILPDSTRITRYGLNIPVVSRTLESAMSGKMLGYYFEDGFRFPVIYHLSEHLREKQETMASIPITLPEGGQIPLGQLVTFKTVQNVTTIARSNGRRYGSLAIYLKDRDVQSFAAEANQKITQSLKLPAGYTLSWGGQFKNLERAKKRLSILIPGILLIIFVLLWRTYRDLRDTILVYSSVPLALTGGVFALYLAGIEFSVNAAIGFIAVSGIAVLDASVLISFFSELRHKGEKISELVTHGAMMRLRPVLMTALVAAIGFLPMALSQGPGAEVQRPLATVVIGGVISSTLLVLIILPGLYHILHKER